MRKDVSSWKVAHSEERGVNKKEWLVCPEEDTEVLFKETQIKDNSESTYADFGESIVSDICSLLGVPCARVELAQKDGKNGCISYNFCNPEHCEELIEMGTVIQNTRLRFQSKNMIDPETKQAYGIEMILEGLESVSTSKTNFAELRKALLKDILTDSLIDHYDRNPSNLSIIISKDGVRLSPKYDNGTSLSISVPGQVLGDFITEYPELEQLQKKVRENVLSKIGYLGRKFVKYPDLETFIFNYYYDDVKDFIFTIQENLTDENIDEILSQEKYDELDCIHKQIIRGKLITNRDAMLERYRTISQKKVIDKIIYNKAASSNFKSHVKKGTIQSILPEYNSCIGVKDEDPDYDYTLDEQIPEKIQTIVDISQLARYFEIPLGHLTKREKNLLKWNVIMENIQKASKDPKTFEKITTRLGFLSEDKKLLQSVIKDKFKDENDLYEAREIIYGKDGIGEANINLYLAKKFVDAATMRKDLRDQRMEELRTFARTMKEAVELEHIAEEHIPTKARGFQKIGIKDKRDIIAIKFQVAREYRKNPRMSSNQLYQRILELSREKLKDTKVEVQPGKFIDKEIIEEINAHTITLENGKTLALFDRNVQYSEETSLMGIDYFAQVSEHPSGNGVTLSLLSRKGVEFPMAVSEYAKKIADEFAKKGYPKKAVKYQPPKGDKSVSCFIVTSIPEFDARIPDITVSQMCQKIVSMFNEKEKDKSHLDD